MSDLVVIVPTRNRPRAAAELVEAFKETCTEDTQLIFAIDENDPDLDTYMTTVDVASIGVVEEPKSMVWALNRAAWSVASMFAPPPFAIGFMGDDHRPRTRGWDKAYLNTLRELGTGIVYGNDLLQGGNLPTQVAMTSNIIQALGYMAPTNLTHLFVDNYWLDLGREAGCLAYLPDVIVEHLHPVAKKSAWDEGYARVNAPQMYEADREAYRQYRMGQFELDVQIVKELRSSAASAA